MDVVQYPGLIGKGPIADGEFLHSVMGSLVGANEGRLVGNIVGRLLEQVGIIVGMREGRQVEGRHVDAVG